jgi:hypothetical protein
METGATKLLQCLSPWKTQLLLTTIDIGQISTFNR